MSTYEPRSHSYIRKRKTDGPARLDREHIWSADKEDEQMRKLCRQGTEAYRKALIKAGHMNGDVHHTGGQKVLRVERRTGLGPHSP